jgi:tRNA pseudouridine55 synthase
MPTGILIIDKPADWTSHDVVAKLRGILREKRIGHGGTLDPMATGVLPVFVGRATRAVELFEAADKEYIAGLRLGVTTTTEDTTGTVLTESPVTVTRDQVAATLAAFVGKRQQIPPMYSAVKVDGKKLYELARQGKRVERKPRDIELFELELLDGDGADYTFRVRCSKGTYVRTLCADLGEALGCGGCMSSLRRTAAGCYSLRDAVPLADLLDLSQEEAVSMLRPVDSLFAAAPPVHVGPKDAAKCRNGAPIPVPGLPEGQFRVYGPDNEFLCLARSDGQALYTVKSFFEVK